MIALQRASGCFRQQKSTTEFVFAARQAHGEHRAGLQIHVLNASSRAEIVAAFATSGVDFQIKEDPKVKAVDLERVRRVFTPHLFRACAASV